MKTLILILSSAIIISLFSNGVFAQKSTDLISSQASFVWENNAWRNNDTIENIYDENNNLLSSEIDIWDIENLKFVNQYFDEQTYNKLNNITSLLYTKWNKDRSLYEYSEKTIYEYNSKNLLKSNEHYSWYYESDDWSYPHVEKYIHSYTYNEKNSMKTFFIQGWDSKKNKYTNHALTVSEYDKNNNLISATFQSWDTLSNSYYTTQKNTYTYDANKNVLTTSIQQITTDQTFVEVENETNTYDKNNKIIKKVTQGIDYTSFIMINRQEITFTYDANGNQISKLRKDSYKKDKPFENENQSIFCYDLNNNQTSEKWQKWNAQKKSWINWENNIFTYDNQNNKISELKQEWDTLTNAYVNKTLVKYYYKKANIVKKIEPEKIQETWLPEQLAQANTATNISQLSQDEKDAIMYINLARLFPKQFITIEIENYTGPKETEFYLLGSKFKQSLIDTLNSMKSCKALDFDEELYKSAKCFAQESGEKGIVGHQRVKCTETNYSECCAYGMQLGKDIALQWLIDHGIENVGHRHACLDKRFSKIGLSKHTHITKKFCAVAEFN